MAIIAEIEPIEILSESSRRTLRQALGSQVPLLATLTQRDLPFRESPKRRPDVTLLEGHIGNRDDLDTETRKRFARGQ